MPFERGPFLSAAFLCEKVLVEQDGVKSAIRIIDRVTHQVAGLNPPQQMQPFTYQMTLFLRFKSGEARGPHSLRITLIKPSGESPAPTQRVIHFEGEDDRGNDIIGNMNLSLDMPGLYWFEVHLDDERITKVPFRVIYVPVIS